MTHRLAIVLIVVAVAVLSYFGSGGRSRPYNIGIHNRSGGYVTGASVRGGKVEAVMGVIIADGRATHGLFRGPVPASVDVQWTSLDEQIHRTTVSLSGVVPNGFGGTIYLTLNADGTVTPSAVQPGQ
jgi:hypothetical protein